MKKISFTKKETVEIINAAGKKTGLKEIDEWLANPQTDHKSDWIFRLKVEPFELTLNGEKRKIEIIDFFCNADTRLYFLLSNILKDNNNFELQWFEERVGKYINFSENRSNVLVVDSNRLDMGQNKEEREKIKQNSDLVKDLKIDWKNITILDNGLAFDLISPQSISLNNRNFTYEKIFYPDDWMIKKKTYWMKGKPKNSGD